MHFGEIVIGLVVGLLIGVLYKFFTQSKDKQQIASLQEKDSIFNKRINELEAKEKLNSEEKNQLHSSLAVANTEKNNLLEKLDSQKQELEALQEKFKVDFENIANKIVNQNSKMMQDQHKEKLNDILTPFKEKIEKFEKKVDDTHKESIRENQSLKEQILGLQKLNQSIGEEAKNLTNALKGENKTQGNWGEYILESVLQKSGLEKGLHYQVQDSQRDEEGKLKQPDVVVNLPDNKVVIIDSKVSLIDYERYVSAEDKEEKETYLKAHINSIKSHIKGLSDKKYDALYGTQSPDFVLLFIPIEPAFNEAIREESDLYNLAFDKNIIIISTSTLLATLKTIGSIWKQENQTKNAIEIAKQSGALYDKFVGFTEDLITIGKKMDDAKKGYSEAMNKLSDGSGNLIRRVEKIKKLGAKANKSIADNLLDRSIDE